MNFGDISGDVLVLVFYIVLTIVLILFGKLVGKTAYTWYWSIDPGAYKSSISSDICDYSKNETPCTPKTPEQINQEALERAQDDGRFVGAWIGFLIGGVLSLFKAYNIYVKLRG